MAPRLSVILPNYNHGSSIGEAIAALSQQQPPPDEIIVVDDGSTDDSVAIVKNLAAYEPTLRLVTLDENIGAIGALNRGLSEARGSFIYFGAADDITLPGLFAALLPLLENNPHLAFASAEGLVQDVEIGETNARPPVVPALEAKIFSPEEVRLLFRRMDNWILTGAAVIRRSAIIEAGGFDATLGALADGFALRRLALSHGCAFSPHVGMIWKIRSSGVSRTQAADVDRSLAVLEGALKRMQNDPVFPDWYPDVFQRRWRFGMGRIAAGATPMNSAVLQRVAARGAVGRGILRLAAAIGGKTGKYMALLWLTLRERPMSLRALIATWITRQLRR